MSLKIIALGKNKSGFLKKGIAEYEKRLGGFIKCKLEILPDVKLSKTNNIDIVKQKEAEIILANIRRRDYMIALDETGEQFSSVNFANFLSKRIGLSDVVFVIGGVYGLDGLVRKRANKILSFSKFTFTHQMIRLLLFEQIYRAFTIINNKKYHY